MKELKHIIDELYHNTETDYALKPQAVKEIEEIDLEELNRRMDDPGLIQDKKMAVVVARMLVIASLDGGVIKNGSIAHKLAIGLINYLERL